MKILFLCFLLIDCNFVVYPLDLQPSHIPLLLEIQDLFCCSSESCLLTNSSTRSDLNPTLNPNSSDELLPTSLPISHAPLPVKVAGNPDEKCCGSCEYIKNDCHITDSCCLEEALKIKTKDRMTCDFPQLRPFDVAYPNVVEMQKLMFRECPKINNGNFDTINKCENSKWFDEYKSNLPVTDATTMYNYRNRYCAYCHNVTEDKLHYWDARLECLHGISKPPQNISSILKTKSCNLKYFRPESLGSEGQLLHNCHVMISKCNVTGYWKHYDPLLEAACLAYTKVFNFKYRNVFCYLCNTNDAFSPTKCEETGKFGVAANYMALVKPDDTPEDGCSLNNIYDPVKKLCRVIQCLFPKEFKKGQCVSTAEYMGGVTYGIFLKLTPSEDIKVSDRFLVIDFADDIKEVIISWLKVKLKDTSSVSLYIYAKYYSPSSEMVDNVNNSIAYFVTYVEIAFGIFSPARSGDVEYMLSIHDTSIDTGNPFKNSKGLKYKVEIDVYDVKNVSAQQLYDPSSGKLNLILGEGVETNYPKTILRTLHMCPLIQISSTMYNIQQLANSVYIQEFNASINKKELIIEFKDQIAISVRMCLHTFENFMQSVSGIDTQLQRQNKCKINTLSTYAILTLACSSISLIFSVLTLIIYFMFKELKSQPGVNNIVLCISLIIAQTVFQLGSAQSCYVSKVTCQVIGVSVHFFWLFLIFWMNSCCIHMFRVFRCGQAKIAFFNTTKTTLIYVLYSFSASLILVLINIIVSLNESAGKDIGYGGSMCYISKGHMVVYLFSLPVAFIVFINVVLFTIVVVQMKLLPKVQNDKNERNLLLIYAKLSTLTGGTWLFGFLSYFLNVPALDYIFTILNASQGMFLFFAFVANRRSLKLCLKKDYEQSGTNRTMHTNVARDLPTLEQQ
ncbi:uncharacterized protein LOC123560245 [Mercenaria mercenaria]|uniref:uncharacterized protein LOC123560245 n=1 Tax=Mercenaria mercenaria TaxID=6596 RepID=UPI00234EF493|nr:uncharacterized protein LOC123560245 [Mercenaria mercenaria]